MIGKAIRNEIDGMNVLCCLLVVFIHLCSAPLNRLQLSSMQYLTVFVPWRIASFAMQGFLFLSALKLTLKYQRTPFHYGTFLLRRLTTVYLPYLIWTVLYYLMFVAVGYFPFSLKDLAVYLLSGSVSAPFYFIIVLLQFDLLFPLLRRLARRIHPMLLCCGALALNLIFVRFQGSLFPDFRWFDRTITTYLIYPVMGCAAGASYAQFREKMHKRGMLLLVLATLCGAVDCSWTYAETIGFYHFSHLEVTHMLYCIMAILAVFAAMRYIAPAMADFPLCAQINGASYHIFLSHCMVLFLAGKVLQMRGLSLRTGPYFVFTAIVTYSIPLAGSVLYQYIKRRFFHTGQEGPTI